MDYEQRHKEVLDAIKKLQEANPSNDGIQNWVNENFPELAESEDELIRKELIEKVKETPACIGFNDKNAVLAWLEKQGEKKSVDNLGPKFKVGDWVVTGYGKVNQIIAVDEDNDGFTLDDDTYFSGSWKDSYHLWSIEDAKDGDVLAVDDDNICIFDGTVEDGIYPFAYCGFTKYGFKFYDGKLPFTHSNVHPATKEQRDLLFQKMHEAGYMWDSKSKQLLSLKAEPSGKQKPAGWSEEDENNINSIVSRLEVDISYWESRSKTRTNEDEKLINWLKSLRPQNKWKPSDEQMEALKETCDKRWEPDGLDPLYTLYEYLKKLTE